MNLAVMGLQWGDEGKGKAIDYLSGEFDVVVRYQGGHNAGHTIYYRNQKVILHLVPSGIFSPQTYSVIGHGVVINPIELVKEIKRVQGLGLDSSRLIISSNAPLILPLHQRLDIVFEQSRYVKIGTTKRGIGPAYEDLAGRRALFISDLLDKDAFTKKIKPLTEYYNKIIKAYGGEPIDQNSFINEYLEAGAFLKPFVKNTVYFLNDLYQQKKRFLYEGAQGILLDINFGTYPFVTSSNPSLGGLFTGIGLSHKALDCIIGISKSYATRVGGGPFPSELFDQEAESLRERGGEYGSTTGRPRRVGWLDLVALKYTIMINGVDEIFLTKLDVLDEFEEIKVTTAYNVDGETQTAFNPHIEFLNKAKPVLKSIRGWQRPTNQIKNYENLPGSAKNYIKFIEEFLNIPVQYISVGSQREQTIRR